MKEIRTVALTIFLTWVLVAPGFAGIRGTEWGMSKAEVKRVEGKPKTEAEDRLIYEDLVGGLETAVVYRFNHREELYSIEYHFHMERSFLTRALKQFDKISKILHENYGPPISGEVYSDKEKRIGTLALERPIIESWEKDEVTYLLHTLREERGYEHTLIYGHRGLTEEFEEFCKQKEMEKF